MLTRAYFKLVLQHTPQLSLHMLNTVKMLYYNAMSSSRHRSTSFYETKRSTYVSTTKVVSVKLPIALIDKLDRLINAGYFQNRSDAIREAIRKLLSEYVDYNPRRFETGLFLGVR